MSVITFTAVDLRGFVVLGPESDEQFITLDEWTEWKETPTRFWCRYYGCTASELMEWIDSRRSTGNGYESWHRCSARTKNGNRCRNPVGVNTATTNLSTWLRYEREGGCCSCHERNS